MWIDERRGGKSNKRIYLGGKRKACGIMGDPGKPSRVKTWLTMCTYAFMLVLRRITIRFLLLLYSVVQMVGFIRERRRRVFFCVFYVFTSGERIIPSFQHQRECPGLRANVRHQ